MTEVNSQVLTQDDLNLNPLLVSLGAIAGDSLAITRPDAPAPAPVEPAPADTNTAQAPKVGDTCTAEDTRPGTLQDDGTGKLVCVPTEAPAPAPAAPAQEQVTLTEGDACTLPDGAPGVLKAQGSKAAGDLKLVCMPVDSGSAVL